jgi:probable FeS assembly SUF system protein SufT
MSLQGTTITLENPCKATRIPSGEVLHLNVGETYTVSQALGGSVTLRDSGGLYRVGIEDADALGQDIAAELARLAEVSLEDAPFSEELVWDALRQCFDPEIPVNIVDLGLIYDLAVEPLDTGKFNVGVKMTLTATGCGMGPTIAADAQAKIQSIEAVDDAQVEIVWDPQWTPHMISDEARKILGLD